MKRPVVDCWNNLDRQRRIVAAATALVLTWGTVEAFAWLISPSQEVLSAEGRELFVHEWQLNDPLAGGGDGLGPVFNQNSCVACHSVGGVGGAGENRHNVTAFTVLPNRNDENMHGGVIHANATVERLLETQETLTRLFPIIPQGTKVIGGCQVRFEDFDPVQIETINTPALFGAGLIDEISGWSIRSQAWGHGVRSVGQELAGRFDGTMGKVRVLPDGRIGKFGWKAQFATLKEFVATACAVEVGLSNSYRRQDAPSQHAPDADAELDMTSRQLHSLVTFCRLLDRPTRQFPDSVEERVLAHRGEKLFTSIGCTDCHVPNLGGVDGIYSDLCLYSIAAPDDPGYFRELEIPLPHNVPALNEWKTPPLWGVADSAPYLHDGSAATLEEAITAHHGEARHVAKRYRKKLDNDGRRAIIEFLKTLKAPRADES
jgi:CxxC motif-containing protein (DUF1111 family)